MLLLLTLTNNNIIETYKINVLHIINNNIMFVIFIICVLTKNRLTNEIYMPICLIYNTTQ